MDRPLATLDTCRWRVCGERGPLPALARPSVRYRYSFGAGASHCGLVVAKGRGRSSLDGVTLTGVDEVAWWTGNRVEAGSADAVRCCARGWCRYLRGEGACYNGAGRPY